MLVAPALRRHACGLTKARGEMALVAKPQTLRDFGQAEPGDPQQPFRLLDARVQYVLIRREARALLEPAGEVVTAEVRDARELLDRQVLRRVRLDVLQCSGDFFLACA